MAFPVFPHRMKTSEPHADVLFRTFQALAERRGAVRSNRAVPLPVPSGKGRRVKLLDAIFSVFKGGSR